VDFINNHLNLLILQMAKQTSVIVKIERDILRPNIHAKSKSSTLKTSKNYKKKYAGQGR
jgi:hypothetical protein